MGTVITPGEVAAFGEQEEQSAMQAPVSAVPQSLDMIAKGDEKFTLRDRLAGFLCRQKTTVYGNPGVTNTPWVAGKTMTEFVKTFAPYILQFQFGVLDGYKSVKDKPVKVYRLNAEISCPAQLPASLIGNLIRSSLGPELYDILQGTDLAQFLNLTDATALIDPNDATLGTYFPNLHGITSLNDKNAYLPKDPWLLIMHAPPSQRRFLSECLDYQGAKDALWFDDGKEYIEKGDLEAIRQKPLISLEAVLMTGESHGVRDIKQYLDTAMSIKAKVIEVLVSAKD